MMEWWAYGCSKEERDYMKYVGNKEWFSERCMEIYKDEKLKVDIYQNKREANEWFWRNMNQDISWNRKLFWKEVGEVNVEKVENCNRTKYGMTYVQKFWFIWGSVEWGLEARTRGNISTEKDMLGLL